MKTVLGFALLANLGAAGLIGLLSLWWPQVQQAEPIDLVFFTGLLFWFGSTLVRLSGRRFNKGVHVRSHLPRKVRLDMAPPLVSLSTVQERLQTAPASTYAGGETG